MCGDERGKGREELARGKEGGKKGGREKDRREEGKEKGRGEVEMLAVSYKITQD